MPAASPHGGGRRVGAAQRPSEHQPPLSTARGERSARRTQGRTQGRPVPCCRLTECAQTGTASCPAPAVFKDSSQPGRGLTPRHRSGWTAVTPHVRTWDSCVLRGSHNIQKQFQPQDEALHGRGEDCRRGRPRAAETQMRGEEGMRLRSRCCLRAPPPRRTHYPCRSPPLLPRLQCIRSTGLLGRDSRVTGKGTSGEKVMLTRSRVGDTWGGPVGAASTARCWLRS